MLRHRKSSKQHRDKSTSCSRKPLRRSIYNKPTSQLISLSRDDSLTSQLAVVIPGRPFQSVNHLVPQQYNLIKSSIISLLSFNPLQRTSILTLPSPLQSHHIFHSTTPIRFPLLMLPLKSSQKHRSHTSSMQKLPVLGQRDIRRGGPLIISSKTHPLHQSRRFEDSELRFARESGEDPHELPDFLADDSFDTSFPTESSPTDFELEAMDAEHFRRHWEWPQYEHAHGEYQFVWKTVQDEHARKMAGVPSEKEFSGTHSDTELEKERLRLRYIKEDISRNRRLGDRSDFYVRDVIRAQEDAYEFNDQEEWLKEHEARFKDPYKAYFKLQRRIREKRFREARRQDVLLGVYKDPRSIWLNSSDLEKRPNPDDYDLYEGFNFKKDEPIMEGWWDKDLFNPEPVFNREGKRILDSDSVHTDDVLPFGDITDPDDVTQDRNKIRGLRLSTSDIEGGYLGPFGHDLKPDYFDEKIMSWWEQEEKSDSFEEWASNPLFGDGPLDIPRNLIYDFPTKAHLDFNYGPFAYLYYLKLDRVHGLRLQKLRKEYDYYYKERRTDIEWKDSEFIQRLFEDYWTKDQWHQRKIDIQNQMKQMSDNLAYDVKYLYGGAVSDDIQQEVNKIRQGDDAYLELQKWDKESDGFEKIVSKYPRANRYDKYGNRVNKIRSLDLLSDTEPKSKEISEVYDTEVERMSDNERRKRRKARLDPDYVRTSDEPGLFSTVPEDDDGIGLDDFGQTRNQRRESRYQQLSRDRALKRRIDRLDSAPLDNSVINTYEHPELYQLGAEGYLALISNIEIALQTGNFDPDDIVIKRYIKAQNRGLFDDPAYRFDITNKLPDSSYDELSNESDLYNDYDPSKHNDREIFGRLLEKTSTIVQNDSLFHQEMIYLEQDIQPNYFQNPLFIPRPINMTLKWPAHLPRIPPGQPPGLVPVSPVYTDNSELSGMYEWTEGDFAHLPAELARESSPSDSQGDLVWDINEVAVWDSEEMRKDPSKIPWDHMFDVNRMITSSDWDRGPSTTDDDDKRYVYDNTDPLYQVPLPQRVSRGKEIFPPTPESLAMYRGDIEGRGTDIRLPGWYMHQRRRDKSITPEMMFDWVDEEKLVAGYPDKAKLFEYAETQARHMKPHAIGVDPLRFATDKAYNHSVTFDAARYTKPKELGDYGNAFLGQEFARMMKNSTDALPEYQDWKTFTKFERDLIQNDPKERARRETMLQNKKQIYTLTGGQRVHGKDSPDYKDNDDEFDTLTEDANEKEFQQYKSIDPSQKNIIDRRDPLLDGIYYSDDDDNALAREWKDSQRLMEKFKQHLEDEKASKLDLLDKLNIDNELFRRKGHQYYMTSQVYHEMYQEEVDSYGGRPENDQDYIDSFKGATELAAQWKRDLADNETLSPRLPGETIDNVRAARQEALQWVIPDLNLEHDFIEKGRIRQDIKHLIPEYDRKKYNRQRGETLSGANFLRPQNRAVDYRPIQQTTIQKAADRILQTKFVGYQATSADLLAKMGIKQYRKDKKKYNKVKSVHQIQKPQNWPSGLPWPPFGVGLKLKDIKPSYFDNARQFNTFKNLMRLEIADQEGVTPEMKFDMGGLNYPEYNPDEPVRDPFAPPPEKSPEQIAQEKDFVEWYDKYLDVTGDRHRRVKKKFGRE